MEDLGNRLAAGTAPSLDDLDLLARFQADYQPAVDAVVDVLRDRLHITSSGLFDGVSLTASTRPLKTIETLIEKLRRNIPLRVIQDIAGIRIVGDLTLSQQDELRSELQRCFDGSRIDVDDRRLTPSHGYRAVHVIPFIDGLPVEIQIRTSWQDTWAQGSEKIGDVWGRWHRYGLPAEAETPEERDRRARWIELYRALSDAIYVHELAVDKQFHLRRQRYELSLAIEAGSPEPLSALQRFDDLIAEASAEMIATNRAMAAVAERLKSLSELESGQ